MYYFAVNVTKGYSKDNCSASRVFTSGQLKALFTAFCNYDDKSNSVWNDYDLNVVVVLESHEFITSINYTSSFNRRDSVTFYSFFLFLER